MSIVIYIIAAGVFGFIGGLITEMLIDNRCIADLREKIENLQVNNEDHDTEAIDIGNERDPKEDYFDPF